jgi:hypothetical protein
MIKTLFGRYVFEKTDLANVYANYMIDEINHLPKHELVVNENSDHGFLTTEKLNLVTGIYLIYKSNELVYIGQTNSCMRNRIGRLLAGIRGTERHDENHSAAYKYVEYFGRDTTDLSFKYLELNIADLEFKIGFEDIENQLIEKLKPLFNSEIYKDYRFQKILKITDTLGINGERVVPL